MFKAVFSFVLVLMPIESSAGFAASRLERAEIQAWRRAQFVCHGSAIGQHQHQQAPFQMLHVVRDERVMPDPDRSA